MATAFHGDWQSSKKGVVERIGYLFDNKLMSDVTFTCGPKSDTGGRIFNAHKLILAASSAVFHAMFFGDIKLNDTCIQIEDADEQSFEQFLRFLYTDVYEITASNVIGVLYLSKKYLITPLAEKCCNFLKENITTENAFTILEEAAKFDENDLEAQCWTVISRETQECINSDAFLQIGMRSFSKLLKQENLNVKEIDLFKAVLQWTDIECIRKGLDENQDKMMRRKVAGESIYEIRFLEMSLEDFAMNVPDACILTESELIQIFKALAGIDVPDLKWKSLSRRKLKEFQINISQLYSFSWNYGGSRPDALTFMVNKHVYLLGVRFFGDQYGSQYKVEFSMNGENNVSGTYISAQDSHGILGYDVMLPKPVSLKPDQINTVVAIINGPTSGSGQYGSISHSFEDIIVTLHNAYCLLCMGSGSFCGPFCRFYFSHN